ncbi:STAS domain-containing protein [Actinomadura nitritigenes]|uniref:STAS domain-containing protein n=1 Tax=Actinomadura nitritigenes TaxID=134602 RepID=UPI003D909B36
MSAPSAPRPSQPGAYRAPSALSVIAEQRGPWVVLVLSGELDLATAPQLLGHIAGILQAGPPARMALELSGLTFCDSSGLNAFVRIWKRTIAIGGEFVLLSPPPKVARYLQTTGMYQQITVVAALPE